MALKTCFYIVKEKSTQRLFLMRRDDFRVASPLTDYEIVTQGVANVSNRKEMPNGHKAFLMSGSNGIDYRVYADYSAVVE